MLLYLASAFGLEWIWLDIAMISGVEEIRTISVNAMNQVYSTAAITLVCDRLILSMEGGTDREKALVVSLSDWFTRLWTMQEALLSRKLVFVQQNGNWEADEMYMSLLSSCAEGIGHHWKQYGAILTIWSLAKSSGLPLARIFYANGSRRTTKKIDMTRALFPLFDLKWASSSTTLEEAQIILVYHLGPDATRGVFLFGPIGLPAPFTWAPLCFSACSGTLLNGPLSVVSTPTGLRGE